MDKIQDTWTELGFSVKSLGRNVFVRTEPVATKTASGRLWLPPRRQSFYGELPHLQMVTACVLASGPKAVVKPGDRVAFKRLNFGRLWKLESGEFVGWIDEAQLLGKCSAEHVMITEGTKYSPA